MLLTRAIKKALTKPAPGSIPLSGPRAMSNDFFVTYLEFPADNWKFWVQSEESRGYSGWLWEGEWEGREAALLKRSLAQLRPHLVIEHYYRRYKFDYHSSLGFLVGNALARHRLAVIRDRLSQRMYNRRQLVRAERVDLLRFLIERTIQDPGTTFNPLILGTELHSRRWFYHPGREEHQAHLRLLMQSMEITGDLVHNAGAYSISPQAFATLSDYEREEQRHQDNINTARMANKLTWAIVIVGLFGIAAQVMMWWAGPNH